MSDPIQQQGQQNEVFDPKAVEARLKSLEHTVETFFTTENPKLKAFSNSLYTVLRHAEDAAGVAWKAALAYAIAHATYVLHLF